MRRSREVVKSWREAYVIVSGPNGLTAAIVLAKGGLRTTVIEAQACIGGGARSAQLTLPGFTHDVCSSVYPLGAASPIFRALCRWPNTGWSGSILRFR